jgi:predicted ferric reductase
MKKPVFIAFVVIFAAFPAFFWFRHTPTGLPWAVYLHEAGKLLALIAFVLTFFQYVLSARIKWIEKGMGLDHQLAIHARMGALILPIVTLHPVLILLSERFQGYQSPLSVWKGLGAAALLILWIAACAAMLYGRISISYEAWKRFHRLAFLVFPIVFVHSFVLGGTLYQTPVRIFWIVLIVLYLSILIHRACRYVFIKRHPFKVSKIETVAKNIRYIVFEGPHAVFDPGQFMFLRVMRKGKISEAHPFTIATSPEQNHLAVCIKMVGDFTSDLNKIQPSDRAYIDMPYGRFSFVHNDAQELIFIAGGIGITPFLSMLRTMKDHGINRNVTLFWANGSEADICFKSELERMREAISGLEIIYVFSRMPEWPGEKGHIDKEMLRRYISAFEAGAFFLCGPPKMMADLRTALLSLGVSRQRIIWERFSLKP